MMRSLGETLRGLRSRLDQRLGSFRGHVDGVIGDELVGWAQPLSPEVQCLRVGLFVQGARLRDVTANIHRADLAAAGIGDGSFGFAIPLTADLKRLVAANGGWVELRVLLPGQSALLGRVQATQATEGVQTALPQNRNALQKRLYAGLTQLSELSTAPPRPFHGPRQSRPPLARLLARRDYLGEQHDPEARLPEGMCAYTEFVRYRNRVDGQFDPAMGVEDMAHFYKFYLGAYGPLRRNLRMPLSAEAIAWLNEPLVIPGQSRHLSRAAWAFVTDVRPLIQAMNFDNPDWYVWATYWWAINQVHAIGCADCLVPEFLIRTLRAVPPRWQGRSYAPSEYMLRMHAETPELSELPLESEAGRRDLVCALLILGLERPDTLRYLPTAALASALAPLGGEASLSLRLSGRRPACETPLEQFCAALDAPLPGLGRARYAQVLWHLGLDIDTMRFDSITAEGHRVEAARLPDLPDIPPVDIQVIGPVKKASGLGQATRLSVSMLLDSVAQPMGLSLNTVDYSLDNPAPEGFSTTRDCGAYKPARINLFHINAESIPLSVAYQPDVMSGAYNIGYVFWELDSPAACHHLALDLLDEIWVSTDYGVQIYQPHTDKPVVNVGMSFEALPEVDRTEARTALEARTGVPSDSFVFLVTFDSFSFVQRKNPLGVLEAFGKAFRGDDTVRLVVKTQNRAKVMDPVQMKIWDQVDAVLATDPRIVLIDETLHYEDLLGLKRGADAYISLHRSEGWGFGMIEAMNLGTPVLATGYSGNMDFCSSETCWLVDYKLVALDRDDYIFVRPGQKWAEPDVDHAAGQMRALRHQPEERARRAAAARAHVQSAFSEKAIGARYAARLREILAATAPERRESA